MLLLFASVTPGMASVVGLLISMTLVLSVRFGARLRLVVCLGGTLMLMLMKCIGDLCECVAVACLMSLIWFLKCRLSLVVWTEIVSFGLTLRIRVRGMWKCVVSVLRLGRAVKVLLLNRCVLIVGCELL